MSVEARRQTGRIDATAFDVAGVTRQARFVWQAWHFRDLYAEAGNELGRIDAAAFDVAGVTVSARQTRFVWLAWHFRDLYRSMSAQAWRRTGSD